MRGCFNDSVLLVFGLTFREDGAAGGGGKPIRVGKCPISLLIESPTSMTGIVRMRFLG